MFGVKENLLPIFGQLLISRTFASTSEVNSIESEKFRMRSCSGDFQIIFFSGPSNTWTN